MPTKKLIRKSSLPSLSNNVYRQPRPTGSTFLSLNYQQSNAEEDKQKLLGHLIHSYTINGFRLNNKSLSIMELAKVLKVPPIQIMDHISSISKNMGSLADPDKIQNTLQTLITLSTTWSIQDRGLVQSQLETMLRSQNGVYKPFISAEVNKSLKLILESNKNLMESYKTFFTSNNTTNNILNVFGKGSDPQSILTPEEALNLIMANNKERLSLPAFQVLEQGNQTDDDNKVLGTDSYQGQSGLESKADLEKLFQDHSVGETPSCLEGRTGTEALMPIRVPGDKALELTSGGKAIKLERKRSAASDERRGLETDYEELPNRADE